MIEHAAMTWLVNALWLVPLIAAATSLAVRCGRLGPAARHGAWLGALVLAVSLPALPAAFPPFSLARAVPSGLFAPRPVQRPVPAPAAV
jgi:hypothetical protein